MPIAQMCQISGRKKKEKKQFSQNNLIIVYHSCLLPGHRCHWNNSASHSRLHKSLRTVTLKCPDLHRM